MNKSGEATGKSLRPKQELKQKKKDSTWWLIPLSKWVITPVINGISKVNRLITGVITHLLSGMSHQVQKYRDPGLDTEPQRLVDENRALPQSLSQ